MKDLEIHERHSDLNDTDGKLLERRYIFTVQTVAGPFEKMLAVSPDTLADAEGFERARSFFQAQLRADLRRLRDQLNEFNLD